MAIAFTHVALPVFDQGQDAADGDGLTIPVAPALFNELANDDRYRYLFGLPPRETTEPPRTVYDVTAADTALLVGVRAQPGHPGERWLGGDPSPSL